MRIKNNILRRNKLGLPLWLVIILSATIMGCDDSESGTGYIQLYNLSSNAPGIYLTVDQYDDDDFDEKTYPPISFTNVSGRFTYDVDTYDVELAWQDEYNNNFDLETVYEDQLKIAKDMVEFMVIAEDIKAPNVLVYQFPIRDEDELDDDNDDEVFNIRILNMHIASEGVDMYYSEADETFNEAKFISQTSYTEMSDNQKIAQDDYIFYLTAAGSEEVLYQSQDISFPYSSEYIFVIRENNGVGSSPFIIDKVSTSSSVEYPHADSEAKYRAYNGIIEHHLLPIYHSFFDLHINGVDEQAEISSLPFGEFSDSIRSDSGDYSMSLVSSSNHDLIIKNHLLELNENTDKTVFFYLHEEAVDEDGDGDIDEDGDGYIDEIEINVNSLVVNNSQSESIYSHQINVVNLIDKDEIQDDYSLINVYFVRSNEIIDTAEKFVTSKYATPVSVELLNNTYTVYVVAKENNSDIILSITELTLDESSKDQFIILERDINSPSGYKMLITNQTQS